MAPIPPFLLSGAVDLAEGYTTNAQGGSNGQSDAFTRGRLGLGLHYATRRFSTDAHYSLTGYYYSRFHNLDQLQNRLNVAAKSELVPNHLFFNVNAFAAPTELSRVGRLSANEVSVSNNNYSNSYGYIAQPVLFLRLGDYAISQSSVSESQLFFTQPQTSNTNSAFVVQPGNVTSFNATERISSTPRFGRLKWVLTGSYWDQQQTSQSTQQGAGTVDLAYALSRVVAILATGGYGFFDASVPLTQTLSGPIAIGGIRISYGPTFNLVAEAGVSYDNPTYLGSLRWDVTAKSRVVGTLTDTIGTPQGNILNNLSTLAVSAESVFSDSQTDFRAIQQQVPQFATISPIATHGLALDNSINHDQSAQLALVHQEERTHYVVSIFGNIRNRLNVTTDSTPSRSWLYGVRLSVARQMRRNLTGYAGVSYSVANEFGGRDNIFTANAGLTYMLTKDLDCYLTGQYLQRESSGQTITNLPLSELVTIVGMRRRF